VSETAVIVTQAAASVKSAAGAMRTVAQSLLKAISPEHHLRGGGRSEEEEAIEEKLAATKRAQPQDLQEIKVPKVFELP
jgi:DNA-binding FrmR family transcriptional regulator